MDDSFIPSPSGALGAAAASAELAALAAGSASAHGAHGGGSHCLNCGTALVPQSNFCSHCGQDTANHPPSLWEFVHEFVSHYVAAEGRLWKSLWGLMAKPGFLTTEYLAGRKQRYVLPLRLILTLGLLFFLSLKFSPVVSDKLHDAEVKVDKAAHAASAASGAKTVASDPASDDLLDEVARDVARDVKAHEGAPAKKPKIQIGFHNEGREVLPPGLRARMEHAEAAIEADPKHAVKTIGASMLALAPYAVLCSLPFFAGLLKLLFWRQPYGAHFVFAMHLHAAWYGMLLLAMLLPWTGVGFAVWAWSNIYPVVALKRVHAASWWTTLLRACVLAMLHWVLIATGLGALGLAGMLAVG